MSVQTVLAALEAKLDGTVGGSRLDSDWRTDRARITGSRYQLRFAPTGKSVSGSNFTEQALALHTVVVHKLTGAERDYTEGAWVLLVEALLDPDYWRVAGVYEVREPPAIEFPNDVRRIGDVFETTVSAGLALREVGG